MKTRTKHVARSTHKKNSAVQVSSCEQMYLPMIFDKIQEIYTTTDDTSVTFSRKNSPKELIDSLDHSQLMYDYMKSRIVSKGFKFWYGCDYLGNYNYTISW